MSQVHAQLRVGLNCTALIRPLTGIGQYTWNLAQTLSADPSLAFRYFYGYAWSNHLAQREIPKISSLKKVFKRFVPQPYEVSRALQYSRFVTGSVGAKPDIYHEPNYLPFRFDGPTIITVHDLSWIRYPDTHPDERVRVMNKLFPPAVERAAHLLTDSEFSRRELIETFGIDPARVTTTLLGVSSEYRPHSVKECDAVLRQAGLKHGEYVLAVGTLEPRKNLALALEAYRQLPDSIRTRWPLVIVGMRGWKNERTVGEMEALKQRGILRLLGFVPSEELPLIYAGARVLVYPSVYEGFGLPVAEAMASGVPVVVSNRASLPEVAGEAGILVDPNDAGAVARAIESLCTDDREWQRRSALSIAQAALFSWSRCAEQTAAVYHRAARSD